MPLGILRINDPNVQPNPRITFISAMKEYEDYEQAQKILEGLAAQFRPIMKIWHLSCISLTEHEYNHQFAGRNWNAGERIEIVLRRPDGSFAPYQFLLYVMAHELAHIKEMNHGHDFQRINKQIRQEVLDLRAGNSFGDGFWSNGKSLKYDNAEVPMDPADAPMFTCAGANTTRRKQKRVHISDKPRAERGSAKLGKTGRQTAIPRKAGGRVNKKGAFFGEGNVLSEDPAMSTYKRQAGSKTAAEARAIAALDRIEKEKKERKAAEKKGKGKAVKQEVKDEEVDQLMDDDEGQWEYEDPRVDLSGDEEEFLKEDMAQWRAEIDRETKVAKAGAKASGSGSKGKTAKKHAHSSDSDLETSSPPAKKSKSKASTSSLSKSSSRKSNSKSPVVVKKEEKPTVIEISDSDSD